MPNFAPIKLFHYIKIAAAESACFAILLAYYCHEQHGFLCRMSVRNNVVLLKKIVIEVIRHLIPCKFEFRISSWFTIDNGLPIVGWIRRRGRSVKYVPLTAFKFIPVVKIISSTSPSALPVIQFIYVTQRNLRHLPYSHILQPL